jgi:hypothetical protein
VMFGNRQVDKRQLEQWMANPQIRQVLNDPMVAQMLQKLQAKPDLIDTYRRHPGIALLVRHGILAVPQ